MTENTSAPDVAALAGAAAAAAEARAIVDAKPAHELTHEQATARLDKMTADYRLAETSKALDKMTPSQKSAAKLEALSSDPAWRQKYENGDPATRKEWAQLIEGSAQKNTVEDIVAGKAVFSDLEVTLDGKLSDRNIAKGADWLRGNGVPDEGIELVLKDERFPASDVQWARDEKARVSRSPDFIKAYLAGEPEQVRYMTGLNAILVAGAEE